MTNDLMCDFSETPPVLALTLALSHRRGNRNCWKPFSCGRRVGMRAN
jgi:hypothetical protein